MDRSPTLDEFKDYRMSCVSCGGVTKAINIATKDGIVVHFDLISSCYCDDEMKEDVR